MNHTSHAGYSSESNPTPFAPKPTFAIPISACPGSGVPFWQVSK